MSSEMVTVWHNCTQERHHECMNNNQATVSAAPSLDASLDGIVWELHPPQSAVNDGKIEWSEAMRWPYQVATK